VRTPDVATCGPVFVIPASLCTLACVTTDNNIGDEGVMALAPSLGKLVYLTTLRLHGACVL